jgi:hypothetical protein
MADSKISSLSSATTPLAGTELCVIVQSSTTVQATVQDIADLASGSNIGNSDLTISTTGERTLTLGGALVTDQFNIKDTSGFYKLFTAAGNRVVIVGHNASTEAKAIFDTPAQKTTITGGTNSMLEIYGNGTTENRFQLDSGLRVDVDSGKEVRIVETGAGILYLSGTDIQLTGSTESHGGTYFMSFANGTAPTTDRTDKFVIYSADESAGNACPHFRTENSSIIKLFQGAVLTTALTDLSGDITPATPDYVLTATSGGWGCGSQDEFETMTSVIKNLQDRVNELEDRLQAHGLIA